jgi:subtilisin-like proprotein convertase family protein
MKGHAICLAWVGVLACGAAATRGDTTWTGGGDGTTWSSAANWSGGTLPNGQRRVFVNGTANVTIGSTVNDTFNRFVIADGSTTNDVRIRMTGGTLTMAGSSDVADLELATIGKGTFELLGGTVNVGLHVRIGTDPPPAGAPVGVLTVDGGTLNVAQRIYLGYGTSSVATVNLKSGVINASRVFVADGIASRGTFNMTGGTLNTHDFWIPTNTDAKQARGHVQLDGGTVNAVDFRLTNSTLYDIQGSMDIRGGKLVVEGDMQSAMNTYVAAGQLTGYGYADTGHVVISYNATSNRTTVTAEADASCFIQNPALPAGTVGVPYTSSLQSAAGCSNVSWQVVAGYLPDGLSLDPFTGAITGTPQVSGTFGFTVEMTADQAIRRLATTITVGATMSVSLTRTRDVWIRELQPETPAYEDDRIRCFSSSAGPDRARRWGLVEFDVRTLAGASIQGAVLRLHQPNGEGTPMKQRAFLIPSSPSILSTNWAEYIAQLDPARQPFDQFGAYELPAGTDPGLYFQSMPATLADLALIQAEANGDGKLTLVLAPDEDGTAYSRDWGDGVYAGEPPVLVVDVGSSCVITTTALPAATQGGLYSARLEVSPGCAPGYRWDISSCYLPPGLVLDAATGQISGRPVHSGSFTFTARLTPAGGGTPRLVELAMAVAPSPADLDKDGDADNDDYNLFQAGFTGPKPPVDCPLVPEEGYLTIQSSAENWVRPSDPNTVYEDDNVQVRNSAGGNVRIGLVEFNVQSLAGQTIQSASVRMRRGFAENSPMRCRSYLIPSGIAGANYTSYLANKDPYKQPFADFGRFDLPGGAEIEDSLDATATDIQLISGEVAGDGLLTLVIIADEDPVGYGRKWGDGYIGPRPELRVQVGTCLIATGSLPAGVAGTPYTAALANTPDCSGTPQWQITACALPPGLTLSPSTGVISGTPRLAGTFPFQVQLVSGTTTRSRNLVITIGQGAAGDLDKDGDVDLEDFHVFSLYYTGPVGQRPICGSTEFTSADTPRNIPDGASVSSVIAVPAGVSVADLNVYVDVTHGAEVDVKISLKSPSGTTVLLKDFTGDLVPFTPRTYDDQGLAPAQPLSAFNGQSAAGNWTLTVTDFDTSFMDYGVLNSWKLIITTP